MPFWGVPPSPNVSFSEWRDTHKGCSEKAIDSLCAKPIVLEGSCTHPRPHDPKALKQSIVDKMSAMGITFPMAWEQMVRVVFAAGPCTGCSAGILLDGQFVQGNNAHMHTLYTCTRTCARTYMHMCTLGTRTHTQYTCVGRVQHACMHDAHVC